VWHEVDRHGRLGGGEGLASSVERAPSLMPMANDVIGGAALSG
jgi:hypothetical protein